jgi:hypothetical protein
MKTFKIIIFVGLLNVIHGAIHIFQFVQSMILTYYSISHKEGGWIEKLMESPWMALVWGSLGIITLYIGYNDYKHHKAENHGRTTTS